MWKVIIIECECGRELACSEFTNVCNCGLLYNWCGQMLRPVEEWDMGYDD